MTSTKNQVSWQDSIVKEVLSQRLVSIIPKAPTRTFASFVVIREFESTAVLTTEGQSLDVEVVRSGYKRADLISRVLLQKRKQIAPERRTGRAFHRDYLGNQEYKCSYMEEMCGKCPDCLLYGFAATKGEGAQRSRIMTDSGFSIRPYEEIQRSITLNAIREDHKGGVVGSAFAEREHIRPQVFFPTIETAMDITPAEFLYILRNLVSTDRYGAEANRQGFVKNILVGVLFGKAELLSNLALTQHLHDRLQKEQEKQGLPFTRENVISATHEVIEEQLDQAYFPYTWIHGEQLDSILANVRDIFKDQEANEAWQQELIEDQLAYLNEKQAGKGKKKK